MIGRLLCRLGYHHFASYHFGEVGAGQCLRCGQADYDATIPLPVVVIESDPGPETDVGE